VAASALIPEVIRNHQQQKTSRTTMDLNEFKSRLKDPSPPENLKPVLQALWHEARGDWDRAHKIVQELPDPPAAWVHAYLHRKEGDLSNARYWYSRAGRPESSSSLEEEWEEIAGELL